MSKTKWYQSAYRRLVLDMHISDWDDRFLSEFDAEAYVQALVAGRVQAVFAYAQSHTGLFNYPTRVGQPHRGLKGRNILQEVIEGCHAHDIAVIAYVSMIYDRWIADTHPEWRIMDPDGQFHDGGRYGLICPNSPYREYVRAFVTELCQEYDFEGIFFDMTFWPAVCYCRYCQERFAKEVGGPLPTVVDWLDQRWVAFQRKREEWLLEFAQLATDTVRKVKPDVAVEHQTSTLPHDWVYGVTAPLARQTEFLDGDFYGDALQGSFVRKLFECLTPNRPSCFQTSTAVNLRDHTTLKPEPLLEAKASAAIADHAAFGYIDAIDPIGTVHRQPHERMGRVFDRLMPFYPHIGGRRVQDVAVYYSTKSKFSYAGSGRPASDPDRSSSHTESVLAVCHDLMSSHLPFGVTTPESLSNLADCKVLVLSNVNMMDPDEAQAIRDWVRRGGTLYASGVTSLVDTRGRLQPDLMLGDVFGVSVSGDACAQGADWLRPQVHYIAPTPAGQPLFGEYTAQFPAFSTGYRIPVKAVPGAQVLATTTLPWPTSDPLRFSSIHSNPPWEATAWPEVVLHRFGQGQAIYCSSVLETAPGLGDTFVKLLHALYDGYRFEADAPASVEVTLFHQPDRGRYVLSLVNFQKDMPNIPVDGIRVRLRLGNVPVARVVQLPEGREIQHHVAQGVVTIAVPRLETLAVFAVEIA